MRAEDLRLGYAAPAMTLNYAVEKWRAQMVLITEPAKVGSAMTGRRINLAAAAAIAGLLLATAGCGKVADKVADKAAEKATEKAIESQTGGSVDVDSSDGKMKIKTGDGEITYDGNGNVTGKSKDGSSTFGAGTKLPKGWPDDIELPKGMELSVATTSKKDGGNSYAISGTIAKGDAKAIYRSISSNLDSAGYTLGDKAEMDSGGSFSATVTGKKSDRSVAVTVSGSAGNVLVTMAVDPAS